MKKFNKTETDNGIFIWWIVLLPFVLLYFTFYFVPVFLNTLNQMQFPIFVPKFDPIGIDLRWIWQIEKDWVASGFIYPEKGVEHFPPAILLFFLWCGKLGFQTTYRIFSVITLTLYLVTAIAIPYLIVKKCSLDKKLWLISIPFALVGLSAYGFQFEVERGQWNLLACCLAIWGVYLYWSGRNIARGFAIGLISVAIQLKLYPAIYVLAFFACRKNFKDGLKTLAMIAFINIGLLFIFGMDGFYLFFDAIIYTGKNTAYGVAQTSIGAFLWLMARDYPNYIFLAKAVLGLYFILLTYIIYLEVVEYPAQGQEIVSLLYLLTIVGLIVPPHSNDYKLSLMPLILSLLSVQLGAFSNLSKQSRWFAPVVFLLFVCGFSTFYSFATKSDNIFIQNNVTNLIVSSICVTILGVTKIRFNLDTVRNKRVVVIIGVVFFLYVLALGIYQMKYVSHPVIGFAGAISPDQMKKISLEVKVTDVNRQSLKADVIVTNNSSINFNTVNTSGFPVRLSWRFVKISPSGTRLLESTWDVRKDLTWTIVPGGSGQVEVSADLPKEFGNYLFEVTIVQDLVQFFHDAGMRVASVKVNVDAEK